MEEGVKEFTVTEISREIKNSIEGKFDYVRVKGEISGAKIGPSGHCYFSLKDSSSLLNCVCWKGVFDSMEFKPSEGLEVSLSGKITSYPPRSYYQLVVRSMAPAGVGALIKILNERREKLAKEGLFDQARKKKIPFFPSKIGIITSASGAVLHDIIHRISARAPSRLLVAPVTVQGEGAAGEIAAALELLNSLEEKDRPEVIIVARGGGSVEDLWAFNEEITVRAVAASNIPVISAVGHETDYTLIDLAADLRAPTPTGAAEMAVPVISDLAYTLRLYGENLFSKASRFLKFAEGRISGYERILKYPLGYLDLKRQRLDEISMKLGESAGIFLRLEYLKLKSLVLDKSIPLSVIEYKSLSLKHKYENSLKGITDSLFRRGLKISSLSSLLSSLDYKKTLKRGFAALRGEGGEFLSKTGSLENIEKFTIELADGSVKARKVRG